MSKTKQQKSFDLLSGLIYDGIYFHGRESTLSNKYITCYCQMTSIGRERSDICLLI